MRSTEPAALGARRGGGGDPGRSRESGRAGRGVPGPHPGARSQDPGVGPRRRGRRAGRRPRARGRGARRSRPRAAARRAGRHQGHHRRRRACRPRPGRGRSRTRGPTRGRRRRWRGCARPARSIARQDRTPRSSPIAIRRRPATRGTTSTRPAARRRARRRPWRRAWCRSRSARRRSARSCVRPRTAAWSASRARTAWCRSTASCRSAWSLDHVGVVRALGGRRRARARRAGATQIVEPSAVRRRALRGRAAELFDARRAGRSRQHLDAVVDASRRGRRAASSEVDAARRRFGEIHAAGQMILEVEAAAYHEPSLRQARAPTTAPGIARARCRSGSGALGDRVRRRQPRPPARSATT